MKTFALLTFLCVVSLLGSDVIAFENLGFEQAVPVITGDEFFNCCAQPVESLLPHWEIFDLGGRNSNPPGNPPVNFMYYNSTHIGIFPAIFNVFGGNDSPPVGFEPHEPINGTFSLQIDARGSGGQLSQAGTVPSSARSIRFIGLYEELYEGELGIEPASDSEIGLYLGGTRLNVLRLGHFDGYNSYGANIPAELQSMEAELAFTVVSAGIFSSRSLSLDDIQFSPIPVPEPSTLLLIGCSCSLLTCSRQMRRP